MNREGGKTWDRGLGLALPEPSLTLRMDAGQRVGDIGGPDSGLGSEHHALLQAQDLVRIVRSPPGCCRLPLLF